MLAFGGEWWRLGGSKFGQKNQLLERRGGSFSRNSQTWLNAKNSNTIIAAVKNITRPVVV
jgi:hypothetical protein